MEALVSTHGSSPDPSPVHPFTRESKVFPSSCHFLFTQPNTCTTLIMPVCHRQWLSCFLLSSLTQWEGSQIMLSVSLFFFIGSTNYTSLRQWLEIVQPNHWKICNLKNKNYTKSKQKRQCEQGLLNTFHQNPMLIFCKTSARVLETVVSRNKKPLTPDPSSAEHTVSLKRCA